MMKKVLTGVLGITAAGAAIFAAIKFMRKKKQSYVEKPIEDLEDDFLGDLENEPVDSYEDDLLDEIETDDTEKSGCKRHGTYLLAREVDFIRFMLDGIESLEAVNSGKMEDIGKITRRQNMKTAEKLSDIGDICKSADDNIELFKTCIEDIRMALNGEFSDDYFEFVEKERKNNDGE